MASNSLEAVTFKGILKTDHSGSVHDVNKAWNSMMVLTIASNTPAMENPAIAKPTMESGPNKLS